MCTHNTHVHQVCQRCSCGYFVTDFNWWNKIHANLENLLVPYLPATGSSCICAITTPSCCYATRILRLDDTTVLNSSVSCVHAGCFCGEPSPRIPLQDPMRTKTLPQRSSDCAFFTSLWSFSLLFFFLTFFFFLVFNDQETQEESCDDTLERTTPTILYHYTTGLALIVNCELFPFSIDWHCVSCCTVYRLCTLYRTVKTRLSVVQIDSILGGLAQVGLRVVELN